MGVPVADVTFTKDEVKKYYSRPQQLVKEIPENVGL